MEETINSYIIFEQDDLHYAIGKAGYKAKVVPEGDKLHATVTLTDTYDFDGLRKHGSNGFSWLSVEANNLGYQLQRDGYGSPFRINVDYIRTIQK